MRGGFEASIGPIQVMRVFESRQGSSCLARPRFASMFEYMRVFKYLEYFFDIRACSVIDIFDLI